MRADIRFLHLRLWYPLETSAIKTLSLEIYAGIAYPSLVEYLDRFGIYNSSTGVDSESPKVLLRAPKRMISFFFNCWPRVASKFNLCRWINREAFDKCLQRQPMAIGHSLIQWSPVTAPVGVDGFGLP